MVRLITLTRELDTFGPTLPHEPAGLRRDVAEFRSAPSPWRIATRATGTVTYLQNLIAPNTTWDLVDATAINNSGQIVGWGYGGKKAEDFLLTPNT
jgi:hypothetical protein